MTLFKPAVGRDRSLRDMVRDGIDTLPPLEPGTMLTHDMIAGWIGEPFPRIREYGERAYDPMGQVRADLLADRGVWLEAVPGVGYKVATAAEMVAWAERQCFGQVMKQLKLASDLLRSATPSQLQPPQLIMRDRLRAESDDNAKMLRDRLRTIRYEAGKWAPPAAAVDLDDDVYFGGSEPADDNAA